MKVAVTGTGYVGLSLAVLLAQKFEVIALDIDSKKVELINNKISPIEDKEISTFLKTKQLNLNATLNKKQAYEEAKFIIVATPTNFDINNNSFDTSSIDAVVKDVSVINPRAVIVIKSTIPIGYIQELKERYPLLKIMFSPEFLREGSALYDNLYPSRIVIGDKSADAVEFADMLLKCANKDNIEVIFTGENEAEAIKLFANTYLAMRVSFFNELDSYCLNNDLNAGDIIKGISSDSRIGNYYNNPSFGYGGYCLPKDTKQLLVNYENTPQSLISAIVSSNSLRKDFIAKKILEKSPKIVGVYRLVMKNNSDNFRDAAIFDVMRTLKENKVSLIVYEPCLHNVGEYGDLFELENNLNIFKQKSDIVLANRLDLEIDDVESKVFTRDIYTRD